MPRFDIVKQSSVENSFRTQAVLDAFDLKMDQVREHFQGDIDLDENWEVGVIYGASGTGKSTIAKKLWPENYVKGFEYRHTHAIVDDMPAKIAASEIFKTFNSVGFSTVWSWLKPYEVLSTGEKMRVDIARAILEERNLVVFDEFTSVVNREVAKVGSFATQKMVRRMGKKFVAVTCHRDVIEWLEPDWTFCTDTMTFEKKNTKDQKSSSKSTAAAGNFGRFLGAITI